MKRFTAKKLLMLCLVVTYLVTFSMPAYAVTSAYQPSSDNSLKISNMSLDIWPEYDLPENGWPNGKPAVFVHYEGTFVNTTGKDWNKKLTFKIPTAKDFQINMVCETESGMNCVPYDLKDGTVSWQPTRTLKPGDKFPFMIEFYYNPLAGTQDKSFTFNFLPSYNTDSLAVDIKAPLKSSNFKINPAAAQQNKDSDGFNTYLYQYSNITTSDTDKVKYDISYTKADNKPSKAPISQVNQQAAQTTGEPIGTSSWTKPAVLIPAILLVILLAAFIYFAIKNNDNNNHRSRVSHKTKTPSKNTKNKSGSTMSKEKKRIRQMLINGEIGEETYHELMEEIEEE